MTFIHQPNNTVSIQTRLMFIKCRYDNCKRCSFSPPPPPADKRIRIAQLAGKKKTNTFFKNKNDQTCSLL